MQLSAGRAKAQFSLENYPVLNTLQLCSGDTFVDCLWSDGHEGGMPLCFPVVGRTAGQYNLPIHGILSDASYHFLDITAETLTFQLSSCEATEAVYPFAFVLTIAYTLTETALCCEVLVKNIDDRPMPVAFGFHPYFFVPDKNNTLLDYAPEKRFYYDKSLTHIAGEKPCTAMPISCAEPVLNEQLTQVKPGSVSRLRYLEGHTIAMQCANEWAFSYVQLYTEKDKPFFCVEPWTSYPNAINTNGPMVSLAPEGRLSGALMINIE